MKQETNSKVEEVSPVEDLMREHGVFDCFLLIYDEILWRGSARRLKRKNTPCSAKEGFEGIVAEVAELERRLGLNDLAGFTA